MPSFTLPRWHSMSILGVVLCGTLCLAQPSFAAQSAHIGGKFGLTAAAGEAQLQRRNVTELTGTVIGTILSLVAVIFFILVLYSGVRWMLARGNEDETHKALDTITSAVAGLIVALGAYALTSFVLDSVKPASNDVDGVPFLCTEKVCPTETLNECGLASDCTVLTEDNGTQVCVEQGEQPCSNYLEAECGHGAASHCELLK